MFTKSKSKSKPKNTKVTRKFLVDLANEIYSSRNRTFLRLCNGTLQNGPDPKNPKRPMHCGLGELYFAMTGLQPEETGIDENGVVELALERSPIAGVREKAEAETAEKFEKATAAIKKLNIDLDIKEQLLMTIAGSEYDMKDGMDEDDRDDAEHYFRVALDEIPGVNDDGCVEGSCSVDQYRDRSRRVAEKLKEAASYLPR
jgi:hypothetical protein